MTTTIDSFLPERGVWGLGLAVTLICLAGLSPALSAQASDGKQEVSQAKPVSKEEAKKSKKERELDRGARRELVAAGKIGRVPRGTKTVERVRSLEEAVKAFAAVESKYAEHPSIVAEAAFRRGQVLGRLGRPAEAQEAFERSAGLGKQRWAARAHFELGNAWRRSKRWTKALDSYRKGSAAADRKYASKCRLYVGKALLVLGRIPEARKQLGELARDPKVDAFERVRAFDEMASSFLAERRFEPARALLKEVEQALADLCQGADKRAVRLTKSIKRMRSRKKLAKIDAESGQ